MKLEEIVKMSQKELKHRVVKHLRQKGYPVIAAKGYVYAGGDVPVLLVAHLDTVHQNRVNHIFYTKGESMMMSPEGIGGDDRAGVYAILQILENHRCHVLLCEDEEVGAQGARRFAASEIRPQVNYIVELDRRGANDAVFYDCDNPDFTEFVCGFGFRREYGSFSDISVIAPVLGVAAVNISAGYYNEHTRYEYIDLLALQHNIKRVCGMVQTPVGGKFEYTARPRHRWDESFGYGSFSFDDMIGEGDGAHNHKALMCLPESAYLSRNGLLVESGQDHMIDESGHVYDYVDDLDAAVRAENAVAYTRSGQPQEFDRRRAKRVKILPVEEAIELLTGCGLPHTA